MYVHTVPGHREWNQSPTLEAQLSQAKPSPALLELAPHAEEKQKRKKQNFKLTQTCFGVMVWLFGKGNTRSTGGIERSESGASLWMKRRELVWMRALKVEFLFHFRLSLGPEPRCSL
jgi:hypothetical protein